MSDLDKSKLGFCIEKQTELSAFDKAMLKIHADEQRIMEKAARPRGTDSATVIPVIRTSSIEGRGTDEDPVREVVQYWSLDGSLLAVKKN